jgi:hypothetical protein
VPGEGLEGGTGRGPGGGPEKVQEEAQEKAREVQKDAWVETQEGPAAMVFAMSPSLALMHEAVCLLGI